MNFATFWWINRLIVEIESKRFKSIVQELYYSGNNLSVITFSDGVLSIFSVSVTIQQSECFFLSDLHTCSLASTNSAITLSDLRAPDSTI